MAGFIILGTERSGTTMLVNSLNRLEGITCFDEILVDKPPNPGLTKHWQPEMIKQREFKKKNSFGKWLQSNPDGSLHEFLDHTFSKDNIVGMKILYQHLKNKESEVKNFIKTRDIKILYLYRQDLIKQAVSHKLKKSEQFKDKIQVDVNWVHSKAEKISKMNDELNSFISDCNYIKLVYEDITQDKEIKFIPSNISNEILQFIGYEIPVIVKKHWPSHLEDRITNYEDFK